MSILLVTFKIMIYSFHTLVKVLLFPCGEQTCAGAWILMLCNTIDWSVKLLWRYLLVFQMVSYFDTSFDLALWKK